ncbi:hypothetical protein BOTBODRAFT_174355 [Botryobasidium botryosum FD-172 SS1]|uniref:Piwi domain-containing protein n=1 Tax=Botryobasidium botryosum (strain FD-172 SS1) TaxID=930990 RepID=A0A067MTG2_BOTB1|nr:hypothetical protein BOTBODRAFT_174355 [Botryobasidium botryosum FD-172 SS1]
MSANTGPVGVSVARGRTGKAVMVTTNHFIMSPPKGLFYHYDAVLPGQLVKNYKVQPEQLSEMLSFSKTRSDDWITDITRGFEMTECGNADYLRQSQRHHIRFFPAREQGDKSWNAPAGLVVNSDITNPALFDFYSQSHSGPLGTPRPNSPRVRPSLKAGANIIMIFAISTPERRAPYPSLPPYTLCCSVLDTRNLAIHLPSQLLADADIVCMRSQFHFDPGMNISDDAMTVSGNDAGYSLEQFGNGYRPMHATMVKVSNKRQMQTRHARSAD